jgi:Fe-S-cluster-containing hydrogenase component 2
MTRQLGIKVNTPNCTGCHICEMVCSLYHEDAANLDKARIQILDKMGRIAF